VPSEQKEDRLGTVKRGQHPVEVPSEMLAAGHVSISKHTNLKTVCRTVQVLPECLRLRKVPECIAT